MSNLESGSCFDLPWVSTIGVGPNGRTVSGVTYRFGRNELNSTPSVLENKSSYKFPDRLVHMRNDFNTP